MQVKKEVKEEFKKELLGYKKAEVDETVNKLVERVEVLQEDVGFLKKELNKKTNPNEKILKRIDEV